MRGRPTLPGAVDAAMVHVPGGSIALRDEGTGTTWTVDVDPYLLAPYPVTRELFRSVPGGLSAQAGSMGAAPGSRTPVTDVSWLDAVRFCNRLSDVAALAPAYTVGDDPDGLDVVLDDAADGFRLPSEAEWEHACRAGTVGVRYGELDEIAWHRGNSGGTVHDAATRAPNGWGLFDTIGNVWEWCWDLYDPGVYGPYRTFRGGGWDDVPRSCRASCRRKSHPTFHIDDLGFRLARSP